MNAAKFVSQTTDLPSPSPAVTKLMDLLHGPDADNDQVVKIIKCDGVLCAKLLAACNSAAAGLSGKVGSIEQAIFHLGYERVYRMVLALSVGESLNRSLPSYAIEDQVLWRHSLLTALIAEQLLDDECPVEIEPSAAYTAALLHDIGKMVISRQLDAGTIAAMRRLVTAGTHSLLEAERAVLATDHAAVGACLLETWRLPDIIVEAVAHHHAPVSSPRPLASAVVHIADMLAHEIGSAPGWDAHAVRADEAAAASLGLHPEKIDRLMVTAYDSLRRVEEMVTNS